MMMGLWECGNLAVFARFPRRGGRAFWARPRRRHFHSLGRGLASPRHASPSVSAAPRALGARREGPSRVSG